MPSNKAFLIPVVLVAIALAADAAVEQIRQPSPENRGEVDITPSYALGDVTTIDSAGKHLTVRTKTGDVLVQLDDDTQCLRLAPGEKNLDKAQATTLADIGIGDRVVARGRVAEDRKSVSARQLIVMTKAAIAEKQQRDREEWRKNSIAGTITAINRVTREVTLLVRSREGVRPIIVTAGDKVKFRRYSPDSVKFADARPGSFSELKLGDQLRALGGKSTDGSHFQPTEIVSGSFVMVGGPIIAVNPAAGEVNITNIPTQKPLTVVINKDSVLRRISPQLEAVLAPRAESLAAPRGPDSSGVRARAQSSGGAQEVKGSGERPPAGGDAQEMLERQPAITIADLKPGDMILVSTTVGANSTRVTAILLAAGSEALLRSPQSQKGPAVPDTSLGLPANVLDFAIGLP